VPDQAPPKKPKKFMPMLDMLNTEAAVNTLSPKTYADYVGIFSRKAFENGEIDVDEYLDIVKPLFGETGEMVTEKIDNYRTKFLDGGDTAYNKMVTEAYIKAGGLEATGMDIDKFAEMYFKKFADGGRAQFNSGSQNPDAELGKRVIELMEDKENPLSFGEAVKQAMKETRENNGNGTMPKSEKWMREYFFDGKGGYDDRMSYKEFALGPGQELYKKFGND
jgi:hypothetical protein